MPSTSTTVALAVSTGTTAAAASSAPSLWPVWLGVIVASAMGGIIHVLISIQRGGALIDHAVAGTLAFFAGTILSPVLGAALETYIPGASAGGQMALAGLSSLIGAFYIFQLIERLARESGDD